MAHASPVAVAVASQRWANLEAYRQQEEVECGSSALKSPVESGQADNERVREHGLLHLCSWTGISLEDGEH